MNLSRPQLFFAIIFAALFCTLLFFYQQYYERQKDVGAIKQKKLEIELIVNKNEKLNKESLKVAVLDFSVPVVWIEREKNNNSEIQKNIALKNREKMELALLQAGFNLIERNKIDKVIQEQDLLKTGVAENDLVEIGKLLHADIVVFGTIPEWTFTISTEEGFLEINTKGICVNTGAVFFKGAINHHFISTYESFRYEISLLETKGFKILGEKLKQWLTSNLNPDTI